MRLRCWSEAAILALGLPAAITALSHVITVTVPAATTGSPAERFLLWISGGVLAEWLFVAAIWRLVKMRHSSMRDIGVWRSGNLAAWLIALAAAALTIASNLRFFPRMGIPISNAFLPSGFHLVASLALGTTAGFCEELLFRGFLMTEFRMAGYGPAVQVIVPGIAFGLSHLGYSNLGLVAVVGIMVPTAILGMVWGVAYRVGRGSLLPCIVAHFLNDATALPWIAFMMMTMRH
jgi:membrane protease YdiL (CAAX protease family)